MNLNLNLDKKTHFFSPQKDTKSRTTTLKITPRSMQTGTKSVKTVELKNSDIVFFNEYLGLLRRKEYNSNQVHRFFKKINRRWNPKKLCHMCGKQMNSLLTQVV